MGKLYNRKFIHSPTSCIKNVGNMGGTPAIATNFVLCTRMIFCKDEQKEGQFAHPCWARSQIPTAGVLLGQGRVKGHTMQTGQKSKFNPLYKKSIWYKKSVHLNGQLKTNVWA